jgi:hypothetical protein
MGNLDNALGGLTISKGINGIGHGPIDLGITQKSAGGGLNGSGIRSD